MQQLVGTMGWRKIHRVLGREIEASRYGYAIEMAQWYLELHPDDGRVWDQLARAWVGLWRYREAGEAFEKALGLVEGETKSWTLLARGKMYENQGRFLEATTSYREAIQLNPHNCLTWEALIEIVRNQDGIAAAEAVVREGLKVNRYFEAEVPWVTHEDFLARNARANLMGRLGNFLWYQGRYEEAVACFEEKIARGFGAHVTEIWLKPLHEVIRIREQRQRGKAPLEREESRGAIRQSEKKWAHGSSVELALWHLEWYPDDGVVWAELGRLRAWQGHYTLALPALEKALELAPNAEKTTVHHWLGRLRENYGDVESGEKWMRLAIEAGDTEGNLIIELGDWYCRHGDLARAEGIYREGLEMGEEAAQKSYVHLGLVLTAQGRPAEALECFGKVEKAHSFWQWTQELMQEQKKIERLRRWKSRTRSGIFRGCEGEGSG